MPMKGCRKCLERRWEFKLLDITTVRATCESCGNEVEFLTKKGKRMKDGWIPPAPTIGVRAPDYVPIAHGPKPGATGDELVPPWIDYAERPQWLLDNYPVD